MHRAHGDLIPRTANAALFGEAARGPRGACYEGSRLWGWSVGRFLSAGLKAQVAGQILEVFVVVKIGDRDYDSETALEIGLQFYNLE